MLASTLEQVFQHFKSEPINLDEFDDYYIQADKGRGRPVCKRLRRCLEREPQGSMKFLFAGHKGCGKSTELTRLQKYIQNDFVILNFSIVKELDLANISYIELFIAVMEKLFEFLENETKVNIDPKFIENISNWVNTKEIEDIRQNYMDISIEAGTEAKADIPFFAKFFAKFKAAAKSSSSLKEVLRKKIEPKLSELISNCNLLIREIKNNLDKINKKGLVIIIEDLDKVNIEKGMDIFYLHSTQLTQLSCHCIYTFPIALRYNAQFNPIKVNYDECFVLPMIKINQKDGSHFAEGREILEKIVDNRMDLNLFEKREILTRMIEKSGGCIWDLFRLIKESAETALDFERVAIGEDDYQSAYYGIKADYEAQIAENVEKGYKVEDYYAALEDCAKDKTKQPKAADIMLDLRNNLSVLNYNGEDWSDVHPVIRDILTEKGYMNDQNNRSDC